MKTKYHTVAMRKGTYERLKDYKMRGESFDHVLNQLMDAWPLEEFSADFLREVRHRMKTFKGRDWKEVRKSLGDDRD